MNTKEELINVLKSQGIEDTRVLEAIKKVPREDFVSGRLKNRAFDNTALPIDCQQTISQPYIVALMTECIMQHPQPKKILEVGTGSGYQAAVLSKLVDKLYTIERIPELSNQAREIITQEGYDNIYFKVGDGYSGWAEHAPYDGIIVTACADELPEALVDQLSSNSGILVIPMGQSGQAQHLYQFTKQGDSLNKKVVEWVSFVPMIHDSENQF